MGTFTKEMEVLTFPLLGTVNIHCGSCDNIRSFHFASAGRRSAPFGRYLSVFLGFHACQEVLKHAHVWPST